MSPIDWSKCMFCQRYDTKLTLNQVQCLETSEKILSDAVFDKEMRCKLSWLNDLIAAEGRYHLKCYAGFRRKVQKHSREKQDTDSNVVPEEGHTDDDQSHVDGEHAAVGWD